MHKFSAVNQKIMGIYVEAQTAINQRHMVEAEQLQKVRAAEAAASAAAAAVAASAANMEHIQSYVDADISIAA